MKTIAYASVAFLVLAAVCCAGKGHPEYRVYLAKDAVECVPEQECYIEVGFEIPDGAYIYGNPKGPGTGKATTVRPGDSRFFIFEATRSLPPKKYLAPGENEYVLIYERETRVLIPFRAKKGAAPGSYQQELHVDALLCDGGACTPCSSSLRLTITLTEKTSMSALNDRGYIEKFTVPPSLIGKESGRRSKSHTLEKTGGLEFTPRYITGETVGNLIQAILFGLLAGFILNFMPCVLPVVSLKVMSFVRQAGVGRTHSARLGLLFSAGIISSFAVLAALAVLFGYNWGQLFQKQGFLVGMIGLCFALALSMFGLFSLAVPSFAARRGSENPFLDSYIKGLIATMLATPCSGPFLGGTIAWSFTQPAPVLVAVFMSVGLGMAFPYIILTARPRLLRFVPRPGPWMITLERIMAFLLLATTVYLIGLLASRLVIPALWFLLFLGLGLWQYGIYGNPLQTRRNRIMALLVLAIIVAGGYLIAFSSIDAERKEAVTRGHAFSMERLLENRRKGKVSVVKFTADWCPNCVLVEKTSLHTDGVERLMSKNGVELLTADLTADNPPAQNLLDRLGSRSIPFLAVFPPGAEFNEPYCLRDIYSEKQVLEAIKQSLSSTPAADINSIRFDRPQSRR